mmetsp:Transcript_84242/g.239007  ORF Transcript_84242/g.239007 Transcript_84242/m.239007 type:complete len:369 (-) Transcript_84242:423-1529(-)
MPRRDDAGPGCWCCSGRSNAMWLPAPTFSAALDTLRAPSESRLIEMRLTHSWWFVVNLCAFWHSLGSLGEPLLQQALPGPHQLQCPDFAPHGTQQSWPGKGMRSGVTSMVNSISRTFASLTHSWWFVLKLFARLHSGGSDAWFTLQQAPSSPHHLHLPALPLHWTQQSAPGWGGSAGTGSPAPAPPSPPPPTGCCCPAPCSRRRTASMPPSRVSVSTDGMPTTSQDPSSSAQPPQLMPAARCESVVPHHPFWPRCWVQTPGPPWSSMYRPERHTPGQRGRSRRLRLSWNMPLPCASSAPGGFTITMHRTPPDPAASAAPMVTAPGGHASRLHLASKTVSGSLSKALKRVCCVRGPFGARATHWWCSVV